MVYKLDYMKNLYLYMYIYFELYSMLAEDLADMTSIYRLFIYLMINNLFLSFKVYILHFTFYIYKKLYYYSAGLYASPAP